MIRIVQNKLIIPRGDTGTFSVPVFSGVQTGDIAVFTILDPIAKTKIFSKQINIDNQILSIRLEHGDTVNLPEGKYVWDIKFYQDPVFVDGELISGTQVDSCYAAHKMPQCEIVMTADPLLTAEESPTTTILPQHLNIVSGALIQLNSVNQRLSQVERLEGKIQTDINNIQEMVTIIQQLRDEIQRNSQLILTKVTESENNAEAARQAASVAQNYVNQIKNLSVTIERLESGNQPTVSYDPLTGILAFGMPVQLTDNELSLQSENAVQNKIIAAALQNKQDILTFDNQPIENSLNPVTSEGIVSALSVKVNTIDMQAYVSNQLLNYIDDSYIADTMAVQEIINEWEART